mmetsp:Transcript_30987/g.62888  ORF Transcript_30987/g.62888 Transcript_30987/m.62888 type:complete len:107 (+) Transcript_30987:119-439(+)
MPSSPLDIVCGSVVGRTVGRGIAACKDFFNFNLLIRDPGEDIDIGVCVLLLEAAGVGDVDDIMVELLLLAISEISNLLASADEFSRQELTCLFIAAFVNSCPHIGQ